MKKLLYLLLLVALWNSACKSDTPECELPLEGPDATQLSIDVSATFEGEQMQIFENYENLNGYSMNFEDVRLYLSDIRLVKVGGEEIELSMIEYFNFEGEEISKVYEVEPGDYEGLIYHVGVPQEMNGTNNPDFMTSVYGPESPLNVQNGMYWGWNPGYKFLIYEGRVDGTPDDTTDLPSVFSIHLGKDQFYTAVTVDLPFTITDTQTKHFTIEWDLAKNQFNDTDNIDLSLPTESQFHGGDLELASRFQALMQDALFHSVD